MKSIVIGGGFISSHLMRHLLDIGHDVYLVHHHQLPMRKMPKADFYFYLAAYGNHSHQIHLDKTFMANVQMLHEVLHSVQDYNYRKFIHFSTSSVDLPMQTPYSLTKHAAEDIVTMYQTTGKPVVSVRPYSVYGEGEAGFRFIPTMIKSIIKGKQINLAPGTHDWIYAEDFVDALQYVIPNTDPVGIGTGTSYTNREVLQTIASIMGVRLDELNINLVESMRSYESPNWLCTDKTIRDLGWKPKHSLKEGLLKTVRAYEEIYL